MAATPYRSVDVLNQGTPASFASRAISRASSSVAASGLSTNMGFRAAMIARASARCRRPSTLVSRTPSTRAQSSAMLPTNSTPNFSWSCRVNPSIRSRLGAKSRLPPLYAATIRAPGTWSGAAGSLNAAARPSTWEVSVPTIPRRRSAAAAERPSARKIKAASHRRFMAAIISDARAHHRALAVCAGVSGGVQRRGERNRTVPITVETAAVHEERRSAVDAAPDAALEVGADARGHRARRQILGDDSGIDARRLRVFEEIVGREGILVLEQKVVHLPERVVAAVRGDRFSGLRRGLRVRMDLRQREVAEGEPHLVAGLRQDRLQDEVRAAAVRALVVAVLHQRNGGIGRSEEVIFRTDRHAEDAAAHDLCSLPLPAVVWPRCSGVSAWSASKMPSAPGFTPTGDK